VRDILFDQSADNENVIHNLDPRTKIVVLFSLIVISVSTRPQALSAFAIYGTYLLLLSIVGRVPVLLLCKRFAIAVPFVLLIGVFLPFVEPPVGHGGQPLADSSWWLFWNLIIKALIGIYSLSLLTATTRFNKLLEGFYKLKMPAIFLMLVSFTYRYLFVLVEEAQRMRRARDARAYGGTWLWHGQVIGQMIGTLFLRSYERGERVYLAMCARGYDGTGTFWQLSGTQWQGRDYLFTVCSLVFIVGARWGMS
jgi:cobalt/nickel transport system permease protein